MDPFVIAGREFASRLIIGTGKYPTNQIMQAAHDASGADMVTVAVRRVNISDRSQESLLDYIDADRYFLLPYTNDDPVMCRKLEDAGAAAVMPLGAPIGSGLGIQNPNNIRIIKEQAGVPVIVDAGVGTASDATFAMEHGADGVLMNTAIALAGDPVAMATAMKLGVEAGRLAYRAGRIPRRSFADSRSTSTSARIPPRIAGIPAPCRSSAAPRSPPGSPPASPSPLRI